MKYYLGVDAGGTHTRYTIFDTEGNQIESLERQSIHFMNVSYEKMLLELQEVRDVLETRDYSIDDMGVVFGLAGYGANAEVRKNIENQIYAVFPHAILMNDAMLAMTAALGKEDGVFVIAGTGSIAFRRLGCAEDRRGGFGYLVGDEGSAFWIGRKLLALFTKEADGRLPKTSLYTTIMEHFDLKTAYDIIAVVNENNSRYRNWVAELSGLCAQCDAEHVQNVYREAGLELAELANSFELNGATNIAFGGSVLLKNELVRNTLVQNLNKHYNIVNNNKPAEYAAVVTFE